MIGRYSSDEVESLVEDYIDLEPKRGNAPWFWFRLMDIDQAIRQLPLYERRAVFLCGIAGFALRDAADLMGVAHQSAWRHYRRGLRRMEACLNGRSFIEDEY